MHRALLPQFASTMLVTDGPPAMFTPWCAGIQLIQISGARLALSGLGGGLSHAIQISGG
jgi:hypothetical protein